MLTETATARINIGDEPLTLAEPKVRRVAPQRPVRVALVGCGAMARENLMPVLAGHDGIRLAALMDVNESAARGLADAYGVEQALGSTTSLDRRVIDAVIIATPPAFHAAQTIEFAERGVHVFVEKPMATNVTEAIGMVDAADRAGVVLAVGLYRRLLPSTRLLRGLLESGLLGAPMVVDIEEGSEYGWPLASLANLTPALGAGGVLIDIGSHLLDVLQFVLPGPVHLASYADNSRGGVETDALLSLKLGAAHGDVTCRMELSRTRRLRNTIKVHCERGMLELPRGEFADVQIRVNDLAVSDALSATRPTRVTARWGDEEPRNGYQVFRAEIDDWLDAMTGDAEPVLSGRTALETVRIIEEAYHSRRPLAEPWTDEGLRTPPRLARFSSGRKRRVLITGASGFIGCRTAEILALREGCDVRALVHHPRNAARVARLPVTMVRGDICSAADMAQAIDGCDAVIHCAVGTSWQRAEVAQVTVDGTRVVAEAARRAGVERFVHISSIAVHGRVSSATLDEQTPLVDRSDDTYGGDKRRAEDEVQRLISQGLRAVVLRPARVYGPFGKTFTTRPWQHLARGTFGIAGDYHGPCSMVYVDNVVEAIVCAFDADESALGQAFAVSEPDQLSWLEFYQAFADALGARVHLSDPSGVETDATQPPGVWRQFGRGLGEIAMSPELRAFARRCMQTDPIGVLPRKLWEDVPAFRRKVQRVLGMEDAAIYRPAAPQEDTGMTFRAESALVVTSRAMSALGYRPVVSRRRAIEITLEWARQSRIA